jgi:hypothetical protein
VQSHTTVKVVVGPGAQLCTLLRGVGSGSRDVDAWRANGLYAEDRGLQVPMALEHVFTREIT